jgi:hypothetical protein
MMKSKRFWPWSFTAFAILAIAPTARSAANTAPPAPAATESPSRDWRYFQQQVMLATAPIQTQLSDGRSEIGTGFIASVPIQGERTAFFLISNAHVFQELKYKTQISFHSGLTTSGEPDLGKMTQLVIQPNELKVFHHPRRDVDLACINISSLIPDVTIKAIPISMFADFKEDELAPGLEVWFAGYPAGYYDQTHNFFAMATLRAFQGSIFPSRMKREISAMSPPLSSMLRWLVVRVGARCSARWGRGGRVSNCLGLSSKTSIQPH